MQSVEMESVEKFFEKDGKVYVPNLEMEFHDLQEAAAFLVKIIRYWVKKTSLFCWDKTQQQQDGKVIDLPEDQWRFAYKTPSTCGGCIRAQAILDGVFGSREDFNQLPFVHYHGERQYSFEFEFLKYFAENGSQRTEQLIEERRQEAAQKRAEAKIAYQRKLREEQNEKLRAILGDDVVVSEALGRQILPFVDNPTLIVASPNVAAVLQETSGYGSTGGVGKWSEIIVFCGDEFDSQGWNWRDRFSANNDRPWERVLRLEDIKVSRTDGQILVEVEMVNGRGKNTVEFVFTPPPEPKKVRELSAEEQAAFLTKFEEEIARIMREHKSRWEQKAISQDGSNSFSRPVVKRKICREEYGVAAVVTEEQIDFRVSDPQMRKNLYVLTVGTDEAKLMAQDNGYEREGGAFLTLIDVNFDNVVIRNKGGQEKIALD